MGVSRSGTASLTQSDTRDYFYHPQDAAPLPWDIFPAHHSNPVGSVLYLFASAFKAVSPQLALRIPGRRWQSRGTKPLAISSDTGSTALLPAARSSPDSVYKQQQMSPSSS